MSCMAQGGDRLTAGAWGAPHATPPTLARGGMRVWGPVPDALENDGQCLVSQEGEGKGRLSAPACSQEVQLTP